MLLGESQFPCSVANTRAGHICRQVLDGQQRLLTLRLWMLALIDEHIRQTGTEPTVPAVFPRADVLNTRVHSLNQSDWDMLESGSVLAASRFPQHAEAPLIRNYLYFRQLALKGIDAVTSLDDLEILERSGEGHLIPEWVSEASSPLTPSEIGALLDQSVRLKITILQHEESDGEVERIFETLNSKNTPLGQYDLFRNYILMKGSESPAMRRDIYNTEMSKAEERILALQGLDLRQTRDNLDAFFQDFVSIKTRNNASASSAARAFQDWWSATNNQDAVKFLHDDLVPSAYAWSTAITAGQKHSVETGEIWSKSDGIWLEVPESALRSIWRIENMSRRSFVPVSVELLTLWAAQGEHRTNAWLQDSLKLVETFVARSILAARPSSPFRATAIQAAGVVSQAGREAPTALRKWLTGRTPSDTEVERVLLQSVEQASGLDIPLEERPAKRDIAIRVSNSTFCALIDGVACQLEGEDNVKPLMLKPSQRLTKQKPLQIEHLFPRSSAQWEEDLHLWGQELHRMQSRLHSLGNTTVLPFKVNAGVSNHPLHRKQKELRKDGVPKYRVSEDFYGAKRWTTKEIDKRTKKLCAAAIRFWQL